MGGGGWALPSEIFRGGNPAFLRVVFGDWDPDTWESGLQRWEWQVPPGRGQVSPRWGPVGRFQVVPEGVFLILIVKFFFHRKKNDWDTKPMISWILLLRIKLS